MLIKYESRADFETFRICNAAWDDSKGGVSFAPSDVGCTPGVLPRAIIESPEIAVPDGFDQAVLSWNARTPPGSYLVTYLRVRVGGVWSKWYKMALWTMGDRPFARTSFKDQGDALAEIDTDILKVSGKADALKVLVDLSSIDGKTWPVLKFLAVDVIDSEVHPTGRDNSSASLNTRGVWGRELHVPELCQLSVDGGGVWCSPASVAMVLGYWSRLLGRADLSVGIEEAARTIHDETWGGTGNWTFNTAFAGEFDGIRAYVTRLGGISDIEEWIAKGVPVIVSVDYNRLNRRDTEDAMGHLIVIRGFTEEGHPIVNDPWAHQDRGESVRKVFARADLEDAWLGAKGSFGTAYIIIPASGTGTRSVASSTGSGASLVPLDGKSIPKGAVQNDVRAEGIVLEGRPALRVRFGTSQWPNVFFKPDREVWDWSNSAGLAVDVYNPEKEPVIFSVRVDNAGADGWNNCNTAAARAQPGRWTTLSMSFRSEQPGRFWGMRGIPGSGPHAYGGTIDLSRITGFQIFLSQPEKEHTLIFSSFRLTGVGEEAVPLPFVDRFGQYRHADWPGKLKSEKELTMRRVEEEAELAMEAQGTQPREKMKGLDRYGGWAKGPRMEATGWFRTQKLDGRWWLVDPDGHLFFSIGVDCVRPGDPTFIEKREDWFEWLPEEQSEFGEALGYTSGVHSMAEVIGGKGRTFSFHLANLIRKFGTDWRGKWRENVAARLGAWGFNTIGNWSNLDALAECGIPFTATAGVYGDFRRIEGGGGYWAQMPDVFDPKFADAAEASIAPVAKKFASNRYCIGYFVDNELAWEAVEAGPLASPPDQPCRIEMIRRLREKYGSIEALNSAWGTNASSWDALRVPESPNEACRKDLDDWVYTFSRRYFEIIRGVLRRHAPRQLYLGCRFAWRHPEAVRAAADVVDVVSFNIYAHEINCADWTGLKDLGKPLIIGEFHFGALDRGMFHQGLVPTADQKDRAAAYIRYVRSVIDCPAFVGCHWFQYVDEPITGRVWDGENYNIGLVDVTDTPYPELIAAAKKANSEIYIGRYGAQTSDK